MRLNAPDQNAGRVLIADWLELKALFSDRGRAAISLIRSEWRRANDDRPGAKELDPDADIELQPEITERAVDDLEERLVEEIAFRVAILGDVYPFELVTGANGEPTQIRRKATWAEIEHGHGVYVFCLLDSAIREKLISVPDAQKGFVNDIGKIFQICACVAVGGYLNADVISFGFPRATGDAFLPALKDVWARYGSYSVLDAIPHGFDEALKDAGIDIIAWRKFADPYAGTLLIMAQVASGLGWKAKAVGDDIKGLKNWFNAPRFEHVTPAMCIPFPLWFDLGEPPEDDQGNKLPFHTAVATKFEFREAKFGVIFDRGRIAACSAAAMGQGQPNGQTIDGLDRVGEVRAWVDGVHALLAEQRVAA